MSQHTGKQQVQTGGQSFESSQFGANHTKTYETQAHKQHKQHKQQHSPYAHKLQFFEHNTGVTCKTHKAPPRHCTPRQRGLARKGCSWRRRCRSTNVRGFSRRTSSTRASWPTCRRSLLGWQHRCLDGLPLGGLDGGEMDMISIFFALSNILKSCVFALYKSCENSHFLNSFGCFALQLLKFFGGG